MRGFFSRTVLAVNVLIASGVAVFIAAWALNLAPLAALRAVPAEAMHSPETGFIAVGTVALFLATNLYLFILHPILWARDDEVLSNIDGAEVTITLSAVEASLSRTARGVSDIHDVRVYVTKAAGSKKPLRVRCAFSTWDGVDVKILTERLKIALRTRFSQIVGEPEVPPQFAIRLARILPREEERQASRGAGSKSEDDKDRRFEYRRPEYPIDAPF